MDREEEVDNPFASPTASGGNRIDEEFNLKGNRLLFDAVSVLLAVLAAMFLRFGFNFNFLSLIGLVCVSLSMSCVGLLGIWMCGGYALAHLNRSWRPVLGIVGVGILFELVSTLVWFAPFSRLPRSALLLFVVLGVAFVSASRLAIKLPLSR